MAGETSAELTIVVRAQDAASRVIGTIGRTIGRVLLAPLKMVGNAVGGIFKQFFSLKGLLVGGGIVGVLRSVIDGLSTSTTKFKEVFSNSTQRGINDVDDALGRLGASIRATVGNIVGDGSGGIVGFLDSISDWLRDNQADIRAFFSDLVYSFREIAAIARGLVGRQFSIGDMIFGDGKHFKEGLQRQKDFELALRNFDKIRKETFLGSGGGIEGIAQLTESGDTAMAKAALEVFQAYDEPIKAIGEDSKYASAQLKAMTAGLYAAAEKMRELGVYGKRTADITKVDVAPIAEELAKNVGKSAEAQRESNRAMLDAIPIIEGYLTVGEASALVAGNITDGFFDIIEGTKSVGQAFAGMVTTIIGELGRLLLYKSLLDLLRSSLGGLFGGAGSLSDPKASSTGALTDGFDFPQLALASGGRVKGRTRARVGENGPEEVILPGGSQVIPSQRSRGGNGGDTFNIYGARDPKATARELASVRGYSASARRAYA